MASINFNEKFLEIANNRKAFLHNGPAQLVIEAIEYRARAGDLSIEEAIAQLSKEPNFGGQGEIGGVNVYHYTDDQTGGVEYVTTDKSTWMTLSDVVTQAFEKFPNDQPSWFMEEWTQIARDYENIDDITFLEEF
jgi:hypothetical protein